MVRVYYTECQAVKDRIENIDASLTDTKIGIHIRDAEGVIDAVMQDTFRATTTSGTASAGASTTLTDSTAAWTVNGYANYCVTIYDGTGEGQIRTIESNTATILTVRDDWATNPDSTSKYIVYKFSEYDGRGIIKDCATNLAAIYAICFNPAGFTNISEANSIINTLYWRVTAALEVLKKRSFVDYLKGL